MINPYKKNAKLVLSNGIVFPGFFFGASGTAIGEIVFNTGMTGYQEVITDPSYYGQLLTFTYPEIGNTGINFEDSESNINVKGIIVRNFSSNSSNWRSKKNFNEWLVEKNIIGLYGIDTRALVKILRSSGAMNGVITSLDKTDESCLKIICDTPKMEGLNLSKVVSTKEQYIWKSHTQTTFDLRKRYDESSKKLKIVAIDFGIKNSILNRLVSHGCEVLVLPSRSSLNDVLSSKPDGIFFSNGPGDPSSVCEGIDLFISACQFIGLMNESTEQWNNFKKNKASISESEIKNMLSLRDKARENKNYKEADRIRDELLDKGVLIEDKDGKTLWKFK